MLIKFTAENVLSFDTPAEFSLVEARKTSRHANHVVDIDGLRVLRGAALYGANAAGKTNLLKAIHILMRMLDSRRCLAARLKRFRNGGLARPDMVFEIVYTGVAQNQVFRYKLVTDGVRVKSEILESMTQGAELMRREGLSVRFHENADSWFTTQWDRSVRENRLCLPSLVDKGILDNAKSIKGAVDFVEAIEGLWSIRVLFSYTEVTAMAFSRLFKLDDFKAFFLGLLKAADVGITGVEWVRVPLARARILFLEDPVDERIPSKDGLYFRSDGSAFYACEVKSGSRRLYELKFWHGSALMSGRDESEGTIRLLHLSVFLYRLKTEETVWFVDEIDCHLHPFLAKKILSWFLDEVKGRSQLVITTHDTNLMDSDLWRTDEIWFAEKRANGSTDLYSMYQFAPRFDKNLAKGYLQGQYGAIPFLSRGGKI